MKAFIVPTTLEFNMWEVDVRIIRVEMKSFDTNRTDNGEGKPLCICTLTKFLIFIKNHGYNVYIETFS